MSIFYSLNPTEDKVVWEELSGEYNGLNPNGIAIVWRFTYNHWKWSVTIGRVLFSGESCDSKIAKEHAEITAKIEATKLRLKFGVKEIHDRR